MNSPSAVICALGAVLVTAAAAATGQACRAGQPSGEAAKTDSDEVPVTGEAVAAMQACDRLMLDLLRRWNIPGGALSIGRDDQVVFARGYGWADREQRQPVQPESLFRVASISKPITAVAILRLLEQGRLKLEDRAFDLLDDLVRVAEQTDRAQIDSRLRTITIRNLLEHSGGWDRDRSYDAMFIPIKAAEALGLPAPADHVTVIRYMIGQPLDFDPGTRYAYSNLGYAILGRIIEKKTGKSYYEAMQELVLRPAGLEQMRLGRTLPKCRDGGEVCYYHHEASERAEPVFLYLKEKVAWPDGGFYLEAMDAHGGWIASAPDLVRFAASVDGRRRPALLRAPSVAAMAARPKLAQYEGAATWYALGWNVRPAGEDANWWHTGSLPGTATLLVRAHNGMCWAALFNCRPADNAKFREELDRGIWEAIGEAGRK